MDHRATRARCAARRANRRRSVFLFLFTIVTAACSVLPPRQAQAHGDVRGMLAPAAYGGAWMIGSLDWWDTKSELYAGAEEMPDAREQSSRDDYYSTGLYHGIGPNTLVGLYVPYDIFTRREHGVVMSTRKGMFPTQLIVQHRILRHDGTRARSEVAVAARGYFVSPDKEDFPEWRPTNYRLAVGAQHFGWRALSTASLGYTGSGYESGFPANWVANASYALRPWTSLLASGRDLSLGVEANYKRAANGSSHRVLAGPMVGVYPTPQLSIAASYCWPLYDKVTPRGLGGGNSLWLSLYWLY